MVSDYKSEWDEAAEPAVFGVEEFIGTVVEAGFMLASEAFQRDGSQKQDYGDSVVLSLKSTVEQAINPPDFTFPETTNFYTVGKVESWNIIDGGQSILPSKTGAKMGNSKYKKLIQRVTRDMNVPIQERGISPFNAKVWLGLKFHSKREGEPIPQRLLREGGPTESFTMLPIQWLQTTVPPLV